MYWNLLNITAFELKRYLYSSKIILLFLVSTIPTLIYLQFAAREASALSTLEEVAIPIYILGILVYFSHFIGTMVAILVVSDIVAGDRSLDILLTSPTSRSVILGGKTLAAILIVIMTVLICFFSSYIVFITITDLPSVEWQLRAFILTVALILFPLALSLLFSVIALLVKDLSPSTAAYVPLFVFFVIPFIIWTSVILRFFQFGITDFSYLGWVDDILSFEFQLSQVQATRQQYELAILVVSSLTTACFLLALLLFYRVEGLIH